MTSSLTSSARRVAATLLAMALVGAACSSGSAPMTTDADADADGQAEQSITTLTGGDPLPELDLPVLGGDGTVSTTDWAGTPTVVNFWATWCAFCVEEMPDFQAVHTDLGDDVRFVGVDRSGDDEAALDFVDAIGVTYDLVKDTGTRADDFFFATQARGMPTTLFVDADGVIQHRWAGPLSSERLRELVEEHLGVS